VVNLRRLFIAYYFKLIKHKLMKHLFILYFFFFSMATLCSAQKVMFINEGDFRVSKENASGYRVVFLDSVVNNSVLVKDYALDSVLLSSGYYLRDNLRKPDGVVRYFRDSGQLKSIVHYKEGVLNGSLVNYYKTGQVRRQEEYLHDSLVSSKCFGINGSDTAYYPRALPPTFKGGTSDGVRSFISGRLVYPEDALDQGREGDVYVYFVVDTIGGICQLKIVKSDNELFSKEALRVVKKSSKYWGAGYREGQKVKCAYVVPVRFRIIDDSLPTGMEEISSAGE